MTICAWIYNTRNTEEAIVDKDYYTNMSVYGGWSFFVINNQLRWSVEDGADLQDTGQATVPLGEWIFVAIVWHYNPSSNYADFYINGLLNSSPDYTAPVEAVSGVAHLEVGNLRSDVDGSTYALDGSMHDVALYNRVLTASEIASNFLATEFTTNVAYPDLLYYAMTNEFEETNPPVILTNYATDGGANGTVLIVATPPLPEWTNNPGGISNALHFNGVTTHVDTSNSTNFNFTTNLFTINFWVCPLTAGGYVMQNEDIDQTNGWSVYVADESYQV